MPQIAYSTQVQVAAWNNPAYAPTELYDVIPYKAGAAVTADQHTDVPTRDEADAFFKQLLDAVTINPAKYDQIEIKKKIVVVPS
jgi:hypothetical protein